MEPRPPSIGREPQPVDPAALLERHRAQLARLVRRLVDPADRDDVTQEVVLAALQRPPRAAGLVPAWIATTVRNLAAKRLRSAARRRRREEAAARPEALASSAELAARLDLEQALLRAVRELPDAEREVVLRRFFGDSTAVEIAGALGLGESTVRARLQRACALLRERLDRAPGGRRAWIALLAPWAAKEGAAAGLAVATAAGAAGGAAAAGSTFVAAKAALALAAAGALLFAGWRFVERAHAPGASPLAGAARPQSLAERTDAMPDPLAAAASVAAQREALATPADDAAGAVLLRSSGIAPRAARLRFRLLDAQSGAPVADAALRAASESRFAEPVLPAAQDGAQEVLLSPATWELLVRASGFEPVRLAGVSLAAGELRDLGDLALRRGQASLFGRLHRVGSAATQRAFVELRGDGRAPCPRCRAAAAAATGTPAPAEERGEPPIEFPETPAGPPCCGFTSDRSVVEVDADGCFRFEGLAAGWYFARPLDLGLRLQPTVSFELRGGERRELELALAPSTTLDLHLFEADGTPFVGRWQSATFALPAPVQVEVAFEHTNVTLEFGTDAEAIARRCGPRLPPDPDAPPPQEEDEASVSESASFAIGWPPFDPGGPGGVDRERRDGDRLDPQPATPGFAACEFALVRPAPHRFQLRLLPARRCRFLVRCAGFASEPFELDLADPAARRHEVTLRAR